jgi:hypothetical protein
MTTAQKISAKPLPTAFDPDELSKLLSTELTEPLENALGSKEEASAVKGLVKTALRNAIARLSRAQQSDHQLDRNKQREDLGRRKFKKLAAGKAATTLPVADLTPTEVIEHGLLEMSVSQLYRATQQGRFYCAKPRGKSIGRVYPAWQFVAPVTEMLPEILSVLKEQGESHVHARMVTEEDDLMELAPAEVLAGCLFDASEQLHPEQAALLELPPSERLALVKKVFGKPSRQHAIG